MEQNNEDNVKIYISMSKQNNDYKKAFGLLILVLERLDENEKNEFINYYSKKIV